MTVKPILFSAPMVRAMLEGRKSMTRRVLKPQPGDLDQVGFSGSGEWYVTASDGSHMTELHVPHAPGDLLYVRETWRTLNRFNSWPIPEKAWVAYEVDENKGDARPLPLGRMGRLRPSLHMPRWASRLTLEVTEVRVERVQDITLDDIYDEGIFTPIDNTKDPAQRAYADRRAFIDLWNSLNAKRGFGWDANPWVSVTIFKVHKQNVDVLLNEQAAA